MQGHKGARILVATVAHGRTREAEDALVEAVTGEIRRAGMHLVRTVVVQGVPEHVRALVSNVSTDNEADAVIFLGGTGIGPDDHVCEALEALYDKRIDGFGDAYRRLLRADLGVTALLARATGGVFNQCVIFALAGPTENVRLAVEVLIVPVLADAVALASGQNVKWRLSGVFRASDP